MLQVQLVIGAIEFEQEFAHGNPLSYIGIYGFDHGRYFGCQRGAVQRLDISRCTPFQVYQNLVQGADLHLNRGLSKDTPRKEHSGE